MIITKELRGEDGIMRSWTVDTEDKAVYYSGIASDFQDKVFTIGSSEVSEVDNRSAQEIIDDSKDYNGC